MNNENLPGGDTPVMENLRGHSRAIELLELIQSGHCDPDLLYATYSAVGFTGSTERQRGFMRAVQKLIERR